MVDMMDDVRPLQVREKFKANIGPIRQPVARKKEAAEPHRYDPWTAVVHLETYEPSQRKLILSDDVATHV